MVTSKFLHHNRGRGYRIGVSTNVCMYLVVHPSLLSFLILRNRPEKLVAGHVVSSSYRNRLCRTYKHSPGQLLSSPGNITSLRNAPREHACFHTKKQKVSPPRLFFDLSFGESVFLKKKNESLAGLPQQRRFTVMSPPSHG